MARYPLLFALLLASGLLRAQSGIVKSANQPIPGATVTMSAGDRKLTTTTDAAGHYAFATPLSGECSIQVQMFGFEPATKKATCSASDKVDFTLQLQESPMAARLARMGAGGAANLNQLDAQLQSEMAQPETAGAAATMGDGQNSNEAFQVSGSLSQGLAQNAQPDYAMMYGMGMGGPGGPGGNPGMQGGPGGVPGGPGGGFGGPGGGFGGPGGGFGGPGGGRGGGPGGGPGGNRRQGQNGQPGAQFGNRRGPGQIHGMAFMTLANSAVNARPFSITGQEVPQPSYASSRFGFLVGGPLIIPKIVKDPSTFFYLNYTGTRSRQSYTNTETLPTSEERSGNFSALLNGSNPIVLSQFPGNVIPAGEISPVATKLLNYFPLPNQAGTAFTDANNYQYLASPPNNSDNASLRIMRSINTKDRLAYHLTYQRRDGETADPFGYFDTISGYGIQTDLTWTHNFTPTTILSSQFSFNRNYSETTPYFAFGQNIAAALGIEGTSTNPLDFGPPTLTFTNFGSLSDANPLLTRNQSEKLTESVILARGKHTVTLGAQYGRSDLSTSTQQNGRGSFSFNGEFTGFDFADFLTDQPASAAVQYSPAMYFNENLWSVYGVDDFKVSANLTLNLGLRWEYFSPLQEKYGEMFNLDFGPEFSSVAAVQSPAGLINPDYRDVSPRVGFAYKVPSIKRSTIIRGGYGIYYSGQSYIPFGLKLAQQAPFAVSQTVNAGPTNPLTLETGLQALSAATGNSGVITNTYAVDRYYRTPYAQSWNLTLQHDLGKGWFTEIGYLGTKGTHLDVLMLPGMNSPLLPPSGYQLGAATGFVYDAPVGNSSYNALQTHLMRRFRGGFSMNVRYNFSKSIDDGAGFGGSGAGVAQNWLDLDAERGLSNFDRRNVLTGNWIYTSPFGNPNSRFAASGWAGRLLRNWSLSPSLTAESGTPLTACIQGIYAQSLAQTGGGCTVRPDATGLPIQSGTGFFNEAAFVAPPLGVFGNSGRNTIPGPSLISVNASFSRSFQFGDSRNRLEFRAEANNIFNQVNYTSFSAVVGSFNYGLPVSASAMRTLDIVMRFRF